MKLHNQKKAVTNVRQLMANVGLWKASLILHVAAAI